MNTILWEVKYLSAPKTIRYCQRCGVKTQHISSGLFRINAQRKSLDIWLIYNCAQCKKTWNLTVCSRVNPKSLSQDLLEKFTSNNSELAAQYAMDISILKKNGATIEMPPYSVLGENIDLMQEARVKIVSKYPLSIRVSKILREKMSLSKSAFDSMAANGIIRAENGTDIHRLRLQRDTVIIVGGSGHNTDIKEIK